MTNPLDPAIQALVDAEQLDAAAALAEQRGQAGLAVDLFERACSFERACNAALTMGNPRRAAALALRAGDETLFLSALAQLPVDDCAKVAFDAERARFFRGAALAYERLEQWTRAATAWEAAREWGAAARCYELEDGGAGNAAKALEAGLRHEPDRADWLLMIGRLLVSHGKFEASMKYLQRVPKGTTEHTEAIKLLYHAASALGLSRVAPEAKAHLGEQNATDLLLGRYELIAQWASTPTARILRCRDRTSGHEVALKWFGPLGLSADAADGGGATACFIRETRALQLLRHPHIVRLIDYHEDGPVLVFPWMTGGTLGDLIARGPIVPARAVEIVSAILDAVGEAHRIGILHRDLKPTNVLFDDAGTPYLADFGVAHMGDASVTMTAAVIGTIGFMSPEQRKGCAASPRSDLYGVGALLIAMLTGEQQDIGRAPAPSACHRNLTPDHDALIATLLAIDPGERPETAYTAKSLLFTIVWPGTLEPMLVPRAPIRDATPSSVRNRLSGTGVDTFTGNSIDALPLTPDRLVRARVFARVRAAAFQTVLRVDEARNELWLERRSEDLVARISLHESALIIHALDDLWTRGHGHGRLSQGGLYRDGLGCLRIAFSDDTHATREGDMLAIASLTAPQ